MATSTHETNASARPSISTTPLFVMVGATDLAVQQVRARASSLQHRVQSDLEARLAEVEKRVGTLDPKVLRAQAEQAPTRAMSRALEVAAMAEAAYGQLAQRGKDLIDRVSTQPEAATFVQQAGSTISRGRAAVSVARRAADDTASVIRGTLSVSRKDAADQPINPAPAIDEVAIQAAVEVGDGGNRVVTPRTTAKKPTSTVRKSAAATKSPVAGKPAAPKKTANAKPAVKRTATKKTD